MIKLSQMSSLLCTAHGGGAPPVRLFKWPQGPLDGFRSWPAFRGPAQESQDGGGVGFRCDTRQTSRLSEQIQPWCIPPLRANFRLWKCLPPWSSSFCFFQFYMEMMESAWNNFLSFEKSQYEKIYFPLKQNTINKLISWLLKSKNLRYLSIVAYLNSLTSILTLKGLNCETLKSYATKVALKGCKNLEFQTNFSTKKRKVISLPLLKILGHKIAEKRILIYKNQYL